jgi:ribonuclease HI
VKACVYIDGGCWPNPGPAVCAAVVVASSGEILAETARSVATRSTNNVAEYSGLILGVSLARLVGATEAHFYSDSQLIVQQVRGAWMVKEPELVVLHARARAGLARIERWTIKHVYREHNKRADWLCNTLLQHKAKKQAALAPEAEFLEPFQRNGASHA